MNICLTYYFDRFKFEFDCCYRVMYITDESFKRKYKLVFTWNEVNPFQFELMEK